MNSQELFETGLMLCNRDYKEKALPYFDTIMSRGLREINGEQILKMAEYYKDIDNYDKSYRLVKNVVDR